MSIGNKVEGEANAWGRVGIAIVLVSVILLKMKTSNVGNAVCASGTVLNESSNTCCVGDAVATMNCNGVNSTTILSTGSFIDTIVSALSEPKNWVIIVIIGIIGIAMFTLFKKMKS